jgi:hypothetical protein
LYSNGSVPLTIPSKNNANEPAPLPLPGPNEQPFLSPQLIASCTINIYEANPLVIIISNSLLSLASYSNLLSYKFFLLRYLYRFNQHCLDNHVSGVNPSGTSISGNNSWSEPSFILSSTLSTISRVLAKAS